MEITKSGHYHISKPQEHPTLPKDVFVLRYTLQKVDRLFTVTQGSDGGLSTRMNYGTQILEQGEEQAKLIDYINNDNPDDLEQIPEYALENRTTSISPEEGISFDTMNNDQAIELARQLDENLREEALPEDEKTEEKQPVEGEKDIKVTINKMVPKSRCSCLCCCKVATITVAAVAVAFAVLNALPKDFIQIEL